MGFADDLIRNKKKLEEQLSGSSSSSFADTLIANKQMMNNVGSTIDTLNSVGTTITPTIAQPTIEPVDTNTLKNIEKQIKKAAKSTQTTLSNLGPSEAEQKYEAYQNAIANQQRNQQLYDLSQQTQQQLDFNNGKLEVPTMTAAKPESKEETIMSSYGGGFRNSEENKQPKTYGEELGNIAKFSALKGWGGVAQGITGIVDAPLQSVQEGAERTDKQDSKTLRRQILLSQFLPHWVIETPENASEAKKILDDPNLSNWDKVKKIGLNFLDAHANIFNELEDYGQMYNAIRHLQGGDGAAEVQNLRNIVNNPSKSIQNEANEIYTENLQDLPSEDKWYSLKNVGELGQTVGNQIPSAVVSMLTGNPDIGLAAMGVGAKGTATEEALQQGADIKTANQIGTAKGLTEIGTEKLTGGNIIYGHGSLDDLTDSIVDKVLVNHPVADYVVKKLFGYAGEVGEETISDLVGVQIDQATVDPDAKYTFEDWKKTALMTLASTGIMNTAYNTAQYGDPIVKPYQINKEQLAQTRAVQEAVDMEMSKQDTANMSNKEKRQLRNQLEERITNEVADGIVELFSGDNEIARYNDATVDTQVNEELEETKRQDIQDTIDALNLEENIDENINENEDTTNENTTNNDTDTDIESLIANISRTEVSNNLDNYVQENNIQELTKQDIQDFIDEILDGQDLNDETKELLRPKYNDIVEDILKGQNKPKTPDSIIALTSPKLSNKALDNMPRNNAKLELKEGLRKGIVPDSKIASAENNVGNQLEYQYKGFEDLGRRRMQPSAEAVSFDTKKAQRENEFAYNKPRKTESIVKRENIGGNLGYTRTTNQVDSRVKSGAKALILEQENEIKEAVRKYNNRLNEKLTPEQVAQLEKQVKKLQNSAKKNNFDADNKTLVSIQNFLNKAGVEGEFDSKMFDSEDAGGLHTIEENGKRKIVFNPKANADTILEELAIHEMTHDLMTFKGSFEKLNSKEVLDYVSKLKGYEEARKSLEETYSKYYDRNSKEFDSLVDEEVVASVLGKKLGNQEYVNRLAQEKPSIARSIYNWVVDKLNSIVNKNGIRSEKLFWENVKNNFENAFRMEDKGELLEKTVDENTTPTLNEYIKKNIKNNVLEKIYEKKERGARNDSAASSYDTSVSQKNNNVKYSVNDKTGKLQENGKDITLDTSDTGTTGTLMAIHNLNEDKANGVLDLGGFPYPSIAITNPSKLSHEGYGDISVLFNKDTINPESNPKNKVYSRDAYTPIFPKIEYKLNNNEISKLRKTIGDYDYRNAQPGDNYISDARSIIDNLEDNINRSGIDKTLDDIKNSDAMKYVYIKNTNPNFKVETKNEQFSNIYSNETLQRFLDNYDGKYELNDIPSNEVDNYTKTMIDAYKQQLQEEYDNPEIIQIQIKNLEDRFASKDNFLRAAYKLQKYGIEHQILDTVATKEKINNSINQEDYNKWVDNQFKDIIEKKGLRNNKDYYTDSGTPRSFEQLHDDYTLDNVVKILDALDNTGAEGGMFTGIGEIAGNASIRFNNIEDIKANENLLTEIGNEEYGKMIEDIQDRLSNIEESIMDRGHNNSDNYFIARDNLSSAIADAARLYGENKKVDANRVSKILNEYGFNPNNTESQQIVDMFSELRQLPTQYFEAKPKRAVGLDETEQWVIPNTSSNEFKQRLQDLGLQYTEYDPNIEGDRQRVINKFDNLKFSQKNASWDEFLNRNVRQNGTKTKLGDLKQTDKVKDNVKAMNLEKVEKKDKYAVKDTKKTNDNLAETKKDEVVQLKTDKGKKIDLKKTSDNIYERVETPKKTDVMPDMSNDVVTVGDKKVSNFYSNITEKSKFITEENRESLKNNENLEYYNAVNNKDTLLDAMDKLDKNPEQQIGDFFAKDSYNAEDMATGWILVKRYQDAGNYEAMSNVIESMREKGTKSGQAIQMLGMLQRLTPEGMEFYAQKKLDNAYNKFVENKSQKEIEKYAEDFTLTAEEHEFIKDTMEKVEKMTNDDDKKVEVAKIVKMLSDKLPPEKGSRIKAWMRISMLGNPKTQVRNVVGNAIIQPFNWLGDTLASRIDKVMSKKTGVRTMGDTNFGALAGGFVKGAKEAYRDSKLGIDTRDINLDRFEENIGAKPFYEGHKGKGGKVLNVGAKVLNKTNQILGNVMSGGDRVFYQAIYDNSLQNQMKLNGVDTPTQEMMNIAEQEALSRTWNDSNEYTKAVLQIRNAMNKLNVKGYGLGDVLIPFAKTPANLTKAIVDYSPVGLAKSILQDGKNYRNSLQNGQYNAQLQHKFADSLGKGFAGTVLWAAAYALAQAGITTGASDDDKDVANFMRNTLGIQPYSVKIGNKSFTYDWAQPIAAPFAIMADAKRLSDKEEKDLGSIVKTAVSSASNILLEQSFLSSIQDVFNSYEGPAAAIEQQIQDLPARATPTFFKQVADLIDDTQRQTYVKGNAAETVKNKVQTKTPVASTELAAQRDTLGREVKKYGGKDENLLQYAFNVFLNPANTNKGKTSEAAEEIYEVYQATGDKTIMPRQVGYSENVGGTTIPLTAEERNEWQRLSGEKVEESVKALTSNPKYNSMSYEDKADVINGIVNYSFAKAKSDMFGTQISTTYKTAAKKEAEGMSIADYYVDRVYKRK